MIVLLLAKAFVHNKLSFLSKQQDPLVQMVKLFSCLSFDSASCHIQRKSAQVSAICSDIPASFNEHLFSTADFQLCGVKAVCLLCIQMSVHVA